MNKSRDRKQVENVAKFMTWSCATSMICCLGRATNAVKQCKTERQKRKRLVISLNGWSRVCYPIYGFSALQYSWSTEAEAAEFMLRCQTALSITVTVSVANAASIFCTQQTLAECEQLMKCLQRLSCLTVRSMSLCSHLL